MNRKERIKSARFVAVDILEAIEKQGAYSNLSLNQKINNQEVRSEDIGLLTELVYGTLQNKIKLDYFIDYFVKKPKKLDSWVRQLLRISIYQLNELDEIPPHAVLNEAVEIAKIKGNRGISGFINGVLRNYLRQGAPEINTIKDPWKRLSVTYSLPIWMVKLLVEEIGEDDFKELGASLAKPPHMSLRVNQRDLSVAEAIEELKEENYDAVPSLIAPAGIIGISGSPTQTKLFKEGKITIQDESSMLVAEVLNVQKNHQVLDTCAAPGGKTTHIAQFLEESQGGHVTALDIHPHKVKLIQENAKRMHVVELVTAKVADSTKLSTIFETETFDRVLVDAPCSGLGLMRRKPEIRYNTSKEAVEQLHQLQVEILNSAAQLVKVGGILVYSTCTIASKENEETVEKFLREHPNFKVTEIEQPQLQKLQNKKGQIKIYPQDFDTDGFFIQKFEKISK